MQKKLLVLAVAAAVSAPAFADDNTKVSVYGVLDAGLGTESKTVTNSAAYATPGTTTKYRQTALQLSAMTSSRLGFLATEDMGGGTKAALKAETGISSNPMVGFSQTGTGPAGPNGTTIDPTTLGNRELNLSVAFASATTVKVGYGSTPIRDISLEYAPDPGGNLVGNILNNDASLGSNRNTSLYVMQQFGPVKATVSLTKDKTSVTNTADVTGSADFRGYLLGAQFTQGAISASFAYQDLKSTVTSPTTGVITADTSQEIAILGASYDLSVVKILGEFAKIKNDDAATTLAIGSGSRTYTSLGAQVPFGSVLGFAQISMGSVNRVTTVGNAAESRKITGMTVGAKYDISKVTYAYASMGSTDMKAGSVDPAAAGVKVSQLAVGLVHSF